MKKIKKIIITFFYYYLFYYYTYTSINELLFINEYIITFSFDINSLRQIKYI